MRPFALLCCSWLLATACGDPERSPTPLSADPPPGEQSRRTTFTWPAGRPDVVLVIVDTLRADALGCYGGDPGTAPEIDALAEDGLRFTRVVAQSSWTRPSIASLLTSRHPRSLGIYDELHDALPPTAPQLSEILAEAGYRTAGWTANPHLNRAYGFHRGFSRYSESDVLFSWMKPDSREQHAGFVPLPSARELFDEMLAYARAHPQGEHYLQVNVMDVHAYGQQGERSLLRPPYTEMFEGEKGAPYRRAVRQVSAEIGRLAQGLAALPGWDQTLLVITSDHGEGLNDHPHVWMGSSHGRYLYGSQVDVPLVLHHPEGPLPTGEVKQPVRLLDLVPTLLHYLHVPAPRELAGSSVLDLARGGAAHPPLPPAFVSETRFQYCDKIAVSTPTWRYVENRDIEQIRHTYGREPGVAPRELQRPGTPEDGERTDHAPRQPEVSEALATFLRDWEATHSQAEPTRRQGSLTPTEQAQLEALGYLESP